MNHRSVRVWVAFALLFVAYQLPEGIGQHLLGSLAVQGALLIAFYAVAFGLSRWLGETSDVTYALPLDPGWSRNVVVPLGIAIGAKTLAVIVGGLTDVYDVTDAAPTNLGPFLGALGFAVVSTLLPSVAEDLLTRGFPYAHGGRALRPALFVVGSAAFYVLNHVYRLGNGPREWAMLFAFGVAYAVVVPATGSLWAAIGLHWGWNLGNALVPLVVDVQVRRPELSPWLSSAANLAAAGVVLVLAARWRRAELAQGE